VRVRPDLASAARARLLRAAARPRSSGRCGAPARTCRAIARGRLATAEAGEAISLWQLRLLRRSAESSSETSCLPGRAPYAARADAAPHGPRRPEGFPHLSHPPPGLASRSGRCRVAQPGAGSRVLCGVRASAHADPHFALSGLTAWEQTLERLPDRSTEAISQALVPLGIEAPRWESYLERLAWSSRAGPACSSGAPSTRGTRDSARRGDGRLPGRSAGPRARALPDPLRLHFKTEASLPGLRGYFRRHPFELLVRLALYSDDLPEWLADQAHRLVRAATARNDEEQDSEWLPSPACSRPGGAASTRISTSSRGHAPRPAGVDAVRPVPALGIDADALATLGVEGADALLEGLSALTPELAGWVWLQAYERHYREQVFAPWRRTTVGGLERPRRRAGTAARAAALLHGRPGRRIRRHLEERIRHRDLGAAPFRGLHRVHGSRGREAVEPLPGSGRADHAVTERPTAEAAAAADRMLARRARRIVWKERLLQGSRRDPSGALWPASSPRRHARRHGRKGPRAGRRRARHRTCPDPRRRKGSDRLSFCADPEGPATPDRPRAGLTDDEQADRVHAVLRNTGLTHRFARWWSSWGTAPAARTTPTCPPTTAAPARAAFGPERPPAGGHGEPPAVRALLCERGIDIPPGPGSSAASTTPVTTRSPGSTARRCRPRSWTIWAPGGRPPTRGQLHAQERCRRFASAPLGIGPPTRPST